MSIDDGTSCDEASDVTQIDASVTAGIVSNRAIHDGDEPETAEDDLGDSEVDADGVDDDIDAHEGDVARRKNGRPRRQVSTKQLEDEGEVGADYLEELLDIADLDGDIDIDVENDRASISIVAEGDATRSLKKLVGTDGAVLEALQELTRLAIHSRTGEHSRAMLDIAGYREARRERLRSDARAAIDEVLGGIEKVVMDPMNPFERKIVHDVVAEAGLLSRSTGEEPNRRVVIQNS